MLFSERDIDALRILRWCQYAAPEDMARVFGDVTIANLEALRLVRQQKQRPKKDKKQGEEQKRKEKEQSETVPSFLTLTAKGDGFLGAFLSELPDKAPKTYTEEKILRRVRFSKLALTAYRAGFSVFSTKAEDLQCGPSLFLPVIARGRLANPWSSSRIAAITRMGDTLAAVHYVCPGIGKILLTDELTAFSNNTSQIKAARRVILFGGESYGTFWRNWRICRNSRRRKKAVGEKRRSGARRTGISSATANPTKKSAWTSIFCPATIPGLCNSG